MGPRRFRALCGIHAAAAFTIQGTVAENIARFDPEATMAQVVAAAELAGAHEMILELPRGYEQKSATGRMRSPVAKR